MLCRSLGEVEVDLCGAPGFACAPGSEEVRELFLLRAAVPARVWCWACWCAAFVRKEAA
jgi:hypothetical protein